MSNISFQLDPQLKQQLEARAAELNLDPQSLIRQAISDYLYLARVRSLRDRLGNHMRGLRYQSEDDLMDDIS